MPRFTMKFQVKSEINMRRNHGVHINPQMQEEGRMKKDYQNDISPCFRASGDMNKRNKWNKTPQLPKGMNDCILCGGWPGFIYARDPDCPLYKNDKTNKIPVALYGSETTYGIPPTSNKAWKQRWFEVKPNRTIHSNKMTKAKDKSKQKISQSDRLKSVTKSIKSNRRMLRPANKPVNNEITPLSKYERQRQEQDDLALMAHTQLPMDEISNSDEHWIGDTGIKKFLK